MGANRRMVVRSGTKPSVRLQPLRSRIAGRAGRIHLHRRQRLREHPPKIGNIITVLPAAISIPFEMVAQQRKAFEIVG